MLTTENKVVVMTGATSGFGKIVAEDLAGKGYTVFVLYRNEDKWHNLFNDYKLNYPTSKGKLEKVRCDLCSFDSILRACKEIKLLTNKIDILINNAGIMNFEFLSTANKIEETLQVNLLSPILLTNELIELVEKSDEGKVIFTTSALHRGTIQFNDIEFKSKFSSYKSYSQSKLGVILMTRLLAKHLEKRNVGVYCQHPGLVSTNLGQHAGWFARMFFKVMGKSPEAGSINLLHLVLSDKKELTSGEYYANCLVKEITEESRDMTMAIKLYSYIKKKLADYTSLSLVVAES